MFIRVVPNNVQDDGLIEPNTLTSIDSIRETEGAVIEVRFMDGALDQASLHVPPGCHLEIYL
jgi:hypothetical protein